MIDFDNHAYPRSGVNLLNRFTQRLASEPAVLVTVVAAHGSVPREAGAWMAVFAQGEVGTIGGGQLEWQAIAQSRQALQGLAALPAQQRVALGPSLGQCCGGAVELRFESMFAQDLPLLQQRLTPALTPLAVFGGGHVGRALVQVLSYLPFAVRWIDSRDEVFPTELPAQVQTEHSDPVQAAVADLVPASQVLIMSFSHAQDLDVVAACLQRLRLRDDLPFIGLIGSATKWATFQRRLAERGFSQQEMQRVTCPIGLPGISGKQPEVIAVAVAAQLLQQLEQSEQSGSDPN
jgi:xanthine dehydrogenase accessory factor